MPNSIKLDLVGRAHSTGFEIRSIPAKSSIVNEAIWVRELDEMVQRIVSVKEEEFTARAVKQFIHQHQCTPQQLLEYMSERDREQKYFFLLGFIYYHGLDTVK